jgi:hypothetical protein
MLNYGGVAKTMEELARRMSSQEVFLSPILLQEEEGGMTLFT